MKNQERKDDVSNHRRTTLSSFPKKTSRLSASPFGCTSRIAVILSTISLIYAGISLIAAHILTRPKRRFAYGVTPAVFGLESRDVRFPARGGDAQISGWFIPRPGSRRAVVLVHGMGVSRTNELFGRFLELAKGLHERGFAVLMIDLRGHGLSGPGRFSFGLNERRDVIGAVDWLEGQGFRPGSIGLLGVSMGAACCLGAAADCADIGAVVSDCSFADILPVVRARFSKESGLPGIFIPGVMRAGRALFGHDLSASRPVAEAGAIRGRLLIIHGEADTYIPPEHALRLTAAAPQSELWLVPEAVHAGSFGINPPAYLERVGTFFEKNLA